MPNLRRALWRLSLATAVAVFSWTGVSAQSSSPGQSGTSADDALLAKAATLYYSTAKAGLAGFDCSVHPDWHELFVSARPANAVLTDVDNQHIALLNSVAITLHARLNGGTTMDWIVPPGSATDDASTTLLTKEQSGTNQTLTGFVQFWSPFVDGALVPATTQGATVTHTPTGFVLHSDDPGATSDETFSNDLLITEYDVVTGGTSVRFTPTFQATPQGLLVENFVLHLQKAGDPAAAVQEVHVALVYQTIEGFPIPQQLNLDLTGIGIFNFTLDGCKVDRQGQ